MTRNHVDDLRGTSRLAVDATRGVVALVEKMHVTIASGPGLLGQPLAAPARRATGVVYATIQGVTQLVGASLDLALGQLAQLVSARPAGPQREAIQSALNGVLGDYLHDTGNPLAIDMELRRRGAPGDATGRLVVLLHGSSMSDAHWTRAGHDHGAALARDLGYTPIYARYNSGRHISTTGGALAAMLEELVASWPVAVDELVLLGHSMGGLVARSACVAGTAAGHAWRSRTRALITLGSPHHGAPLERGGNWIDTLLDASPYTAPLGALGRIRSAGITDLRFGNVLDEHWHGRDRFARGDDPRSPCPLPADLACFAVAGTQSADGASQPRGDGLVPVASALGVHPRAELDLGFPASRRLVAPGTRHADLLASPAIYARLRDWLG